MQRTRVFVSYSHKDKEWLDRLHVHLRPLVRNNTLDVWSDGRINPGQDWKTEIEEAISKAKVAILLVSADFLASDFIVEDELPPLLEKAEKEGAKIFPIVVSPCRFIETREISRYQSINDPLWPLLSLPVAEQEGVFLKLSRAIERISEPVTPLKASVPKQKTEEEKILSNEPNIKVIGVGGGGGNAVQNMADTGIDGVELISVNSDVQALKSLNNQSVLQIGKAITKGLGAGANPEVGRKSALESSDAIADALKDTDLLFITAGMGGGTGTGGAPVIAKIAKEAGILTIAVVTRPFSFEGGKRARNAEEGIKELSEHADSMIVIPNEKIFAVVDSNESLLQAFKRVNDVLKWVVQGIAYLLVRPGLVNVDLADMKTVLQDKGYARMGTGVASKDISCARDAAVSALENPLTEELRPKDKQSLLVNIVGGEDLSIGDIDEIGAVIKDQFHEDTTIILGTAVTNELKNEIRVTVVATGYERTQSANNAFQWTSSISRRRH